MGNCYLIFVINLYYNMRKIFCFVNPYLFRLFSIIYKITGKSINIVPFLELELPKCSYCKECKGRNMNCSTCKTGDLCKIYKKYGFEL